MTIKDIARLSGVGVSTVSRVLNNKPDVSDENRRKVLDVITQHHYIPNDSARDLVKTKSDAIGLVIRGLQNPFYTNIIRTIDRRLDEAGYSMVMRLISSHDDELRCGAMMAREKRLQGIIFLGGRSDYSKAEIAKIGVPFVCCSYTNAYGTLQAGDYSSVSIADEQEAYRAVMELHKNGHTHIAALTADPFDHSISQLRYSGYARALRDIGQSREDVICSRDFHIESAYRAMCDRLTHPVDFTALFAISDDMAIGAMRALRESGRSLPKDCSIIAIDGLAVSEYISPILTTLCQPTEEMGRKSVELLLHIIRGGEAEHLTLQTVLRTGQSISPLSGTADAAQLTRKG